MHRYIEQLISDIRQATWKIRPPHEIWDGVDPDDEVENEDLSYVEETIYGQKEKISAITGIRKELLPPPDLLNIEQAELIATELEKMLNVFNFFPDFPEDFPAHLRYPFLINIWENEYVPLSFGELHIELCSYDANECPFPGYCKICNEITAQMEADENPQSKIPDEEIDLPF